MWLTKRLNADTEGDGGKLVAQRSITGLFIIILVTFDFDGRTFCWHAQVCEPLSESVKNFFDNIREIIQNACSFILFSTVLSKIFHINFLHIVRKKK